MAKPTWLQVLKSVLAAFAGIQSQKNREQDFTEGNFKHYLIAGIAMTVLLILLLVSLVSLVI
jgi:hypothetical protein